MVRHLAVLLGLMMLAGLAAPVSAQDPGERQAEVDKTEKKGGSAGEPRSSAQPGPDWLEQDPGYPTAEELDIDTGADVFDAGPAVSTRVRVDESKIASRTAERRAPRSGGSARKPSPAQDKKDGRALRGPVVEALAARERVDFDKEPAGRSQGQGRSEGKTVRGSVLEGKVRLERPASARAKAVGLQFADAELTEKLSGVGLAFGLSFEDAPTVKASDGLVSDDGSVQLGAESGWVVEFDLSLFADSLVDPAAVGFVINIDCTEKGLCRGREFLKSTVDLDAWTVSVEIPENVLAAITEGPDKTGNGRDGTIGVSVGGIFFQGGNDGSGDSLISGINVAQGAIANFSASLTGSLPSWQVGLQTGSAEVSYPLALPASPGPVPNLDLMYSSGLVDGLSSAANGQPSRLGLGWAEPTAVISRATELCARNGTADRDRLCPAYGRHDGFNLSFNGVSSKLVRISDIGGDPHPNYSSGVTMWEYALEERNSWRVRRVEQPSIAGTSTSNGDVWGTWWELTTGDGTLYVFGRERAFNPAPSQSDRDNVPATEWNRDGVQADPLLGSILSAHMQFPEDSSNPAACVDDEDEAVEFCEIALAWHLDQVIDTSGNRSLYYYITEQNDFKPSGTDDYLTYDREVRLRAVLYGTRYETNAPTTWNSGNAPFRVLVDYGDPGEPNDPRKDFPDLDCVSGNRTNCQQTPTFYSKVRTHGIYVLVGGSYKYGWRFDQHVDEKDLWLAKINRVDITVVGNDLEFAEPIPAVEFKKKQLANLINLGCPRKRCQPVLESVLV